MSKRMIFVAILTGALISAGLFIFRWKTAPNKPLQQLSNAAAWKIKHKELDCYPYREKIWKHLLAEYQFVGMHKDTVQQLLGFPRYLEYMTDEPSYFYYWVTCNHSVKLQFEFDTNYVIRLLTLDSVFNVHRTLDTVQIDSLLLAPKEVTTKDIVAAKASPTTDYTARKASHNFPDTEYNSTAFNKKYWNEFRVWNTFRYYPFRQKMLDDVLSKYDFKNKTKSAIISILGNEYFVPKHPSNEISTIDLYYVLNIEKSLTASFIFHVLVFTFEKDKVVEVHTDFIED